MATSDTYAKAVSTYGASVKAKLKNPAATGAPEDQLRAPLEALIADLREVIGLAADGAVAVGETSLSDLKTRPDFAITAKGALVGFMEVKAPGKGADPRTFTDPHDKEQWTKLKALPNLIYTDGASFSLWRSGMLEGEIVHLNGDLFSAGASLAAPSGLLALLQSFFQWQPTPPRTAKQLAETTARLCRLLRDEALEQLAKGDEGLAGLAKDWRWLLFPDASDAQFADGYAQAVTFGLLMAKARNLSLAENLSVVAAELRKFDTLIGSALNLLTDEASSKETLKTSLRTLTRVLDVVDWTLISKGDPEAWLYFYEDFLEVYDNKLRKRTGSYYTPPEVVTSMVRMVDEILRDASRFNTPAGLAASNVTIADPAVGSGTFLLAVLRRIADFVENDQGPGAVPGATQAALTRLIGFELQFGPFSVAQLRLVAEVADLTKSTTGAPLQLFVTDTLGNPNDDETHIPQLLAPIADSRRCANRIKREQRITVVIGNPPYKEKAKGKGGWIENGDPHASNTVPALKSWIAPRDWGIGAHAKHLRNLYIYFWRWAAWKVFGDIGGAPGPTTPQQRGVVNFITVAGFLNGQGFEKMRADLRGHTDEIWVIDCSPEGHQPDVNTRIFQDVQHPVCIVLAAKHETTNLETPATVRFRSLAPGHRTAKFAELSAISLFGDGWTTCPIEWRAPFLPAAAGVWASCAPLDKLFAYNGSGVMPGRTWVIAPDRESLHHRWARLVAETDFDRKQHLFHPHLRNGVPGDRHINKGVSEGLGQNEHRSGPVLSDKAAAVAPVPYALRSFDREWIIPDARLLNQPNPKLWTLHSDRQVYLTSPEDRTPSNGPALTLSGLIPDLHHYNGRGGRAFPLWTDRAAQASNVKAGVVSLLRHAFGHVVSAEEVFAYLAAVAANPAYTERFKGDLKQPGLRIPITANYARFSEAVTLGREIIWLHTFGERCVDPAAGRLLGPPRMAIGQGPRIPKQGAIPTTPEDFPDEMSYGADARLLRVGKGVIENVPPEVWAYEVSGKQVLTQWFSYRKKDRSRPLIGDKRPNSPLADIQPKGWLPEYTEELMNVLHVLGRLVLLEPAQATLLEQICAGPLITDATLREADAYEGGGAATQATQDDEQPSML